MPLKIKIDISPVGLIFLLDSFNYFFLPPCPVGGGGGAIVGRGFTPPFFSMPSLSGSGSGIGVFLSLLMFFFLLPYYSFIEWQSSALYCYIISLS
jgi:hypothetical protein